MRPMIQILIFSNRYGYNGTACLLRAICETSENPFHEYNGVFGNIFHILFAYATQFNFISKFSNQSLLSSHQNPIFSPRPSSSKREKIPSIYYDAEHHGTMQECYRYSNNCNISFLDLVSNMVSMGRQKFR